LIELLRIGRRCRTAARRTHQLTMTTMIRYARQWTSCRPSYYLANSL